MLKMVCICDRCKKQFEAKLAQRISLNTLYRRKKQYNQKLLKPWRKRSLKRRVTIARSAWQKLRIS